MTQLTFSTRIDWGQREVGDADTTVSWRLDTTPELHLSTGDHAKRAKQIELIKIRRKTELKIPKGTIPRPLLLNVFLPHHTLTTKHSCCLLKYLLVRRGGGCVRMTDTGVLHVR